MSNEISFQLEHQEADNLWGTLSSTKPAQIHADPGVPYLVHELRMTLKDLQKEPDEEMPFIQTPQGMGALPDRVAYCKKHDLTLEYFPKAGVEWVFPQRLLVILKLVLKDAVKLQSGASFETFVKMCATLRLTGWFKKNFNKAVSITLDDDCDLDPEPGKEQEADEAADEPDGGPKDTAMGAAAD